MSLPAVSVHPGRRGGDFHGSVDRFGQSHQLDRILGIAVIARRDHEGAKAEARLHGRRAQHVLRCQRAVGTREDDPRPAAQRDVGPRGSQFDPVTESVALGRFHRERGHVIRRGVSRNAGHRITFSAAQRHHLTTGHANDVLSPSERPVA